MYILFYMTFEYEDRTEFIQFIYIVLLIHTVYRYTTSDLLQFKALFIVAFFNFYAVHMLYVYTRIKCVDIFKKCPVTFGSYIFTYGYVN